MFYRTSVSIEDADRKAQWNLATKQLIYESSIRYELSLSYAEPANLYFAFHGKKDVSTSC